MKITKQQLIESLDREEYSITELQNKIKSFFSQKDADSKKEIAKELHLHFQSLFEFYPEKILKYATRR